MTEAVGMSAHERDLRERVAEVQEANIDGLPEGTVIDMVRVPVGVLRGLLHDMDLWREIARTEIDLMSFDARVRVARTILDEAYPETIFPRIALVEGENRIVVERGNLGPPYVKLLREVIDMIEKTR